MNRRRIQLNCLAAASALLATVLFCGYLVTLRLEAGCKTPSTHFYGIVADLENGRLLLGIDDHLVKANSSQISFQIRDTGIRGR